MYILSAAKGIVKYFKTKILIRKGIFLTLRPKAAPPARENALTSGGHRGKMMPHAGMVELVDSVDLGDVTSVKVFPFAARTEKFNTRA